MKALYHGYRLPAEIITRAARWRFCSEVGLRDFEALPFEHGLHAWMHHLWRLHMRFERRPNIHEDLLKTGRGMNCWNTLQRAQQPL